MADPSEIPRKRTAKPRTRSELSARVKELIQGGTDYRRFVRELRAGSPGLLLSFAIHLLLCISLLFWIIPGARDNPVAGFIGSFINPNDKQAKVEEEDKPLELDVNVVPMPKVPRTRGDDPVEVKPPPAVRKPAEVAVSGALASRGADAKAALVADLGGSEESEKAVKLGLDWLKRVQRKDGRWQINKTEGPPGYSEEGTISFRADVGGTGLALLAFLGAGHTHQQGLYQKEVRRGLDWLKQTQQSDGNLYDGGRGDQSMFYSHGQATIALCEAYAMTRDPALEQPTRNALQFIYASQHPEKGGWKYSPGAHGDLSVFGWQLMALQSARMAGIEVPEEVLTRASNFLDTVQSDAGARYRYEELSDRTFTPAMTAEGLLCRQYLGWPRDHPAMVDGLKFITQPDLLPAWTAGKRNVYFWYYATQALHNVQGEAWDRWNAALRDELVKNQELGGVQRGSWHPTRTPGERDEYAAAGGRLYVTCLCILTLEVYYRHLPLYGTHAPMN